MTDFVTFKQFLKEDLLKESIPTVWDKKVQNVVSQEDEEVKPRRFRKPTQEEIAANRKWNARKDVSGMQDRGGYETMDSPALRGKSQEDEESESAWPFNDDDCHYCGGSGESRNYEDEKCEYCDGSGKAEDVDEDEEVDMDGNNVDVDDAEDDFEDEDEDDFESGDTEDEDEFEDDDIDDEEEPEDPDHMGVIRKVKDAHLVYKRADEEGTFEELWMYKAGEEMTDELDVRRDILAGTDIPQGKTKSEDNTQKFDLWTSGNVQFLHITGLPN